MKRIIAILLVFCFLMLTVVSLAACGKKNKGTKDTSDSSSGTSDSAGNGGENNGGENNGGNGGATNGDITLAETDEYGQNLLVSAIDVDAHDYDSLELVVLMRDSVNYFREWGKLEGDAADVEVTLDEAIETRNAIVQGDLNIAPYFLRESKNEVEYNNLIVNDVVGGLHNYDIVANYAYFASDTSIRDADAYANMADKDLFRFFDFRLPCWNQALIQNTTLNGKLYLVAGDANLSLFDKTSVIWANLDLYEQYKKDNDPDDIQQHAIDGNWVYSDLYSWCLRTADTDPKTECGDFHGFSTGFHFFDALPLAWDFAFLNTDNEGRHTFNIEENSKAEEALGIIRSMLDSRGYAASHHQDSTKNICNCGTGMVGHFANGSYAFISDQLYSGENQNLLIRNMTDKYTILPIPKYEIGQENYGTYAADIYNLVAVVNHFDSERPTDGDAVSAYLQYLNEKSYTDVREFYFTRIIRSKFFGTDDSDGSVTKSVKIFNIIVNSVELTVDTIYSRSINDIAWLWRDNILRGEGASLSAAFQENTLSGGGLVKTKAQYEEKLAAFDAWIFDE